MKTIILFLCLFTFINTGFTQERQGIKATKISLIPPVGFTATKNSRGFENKLTGASIVIMELKAPYQRAVSDFADATKRFPHGVIQLDRKEAKANNVEGLLIKQKQSAASGDFYTQIFVFADGKSSVTITALYPANSESDDLIENALLSCRVGRFEYAVELLEKRLRKDNHFIPYQSATGVLSYVYSSKTKDENTGLTFSLKQDTMTLDTSNRKTVAINKVQRYDNLRSTRIQNIRPIKISDFEGYEMLGEARGKGIPVHFVYGIVLFGSNNEVFTFYAIGGKSATPEFYAFTQMVRSFH
jgi:tetratricopeptide (TPR) repeat protein